MALPARYNVIGAFADETKARRAAQHLGQLGVSERDLRLVKAQSNRDPDRVSAMRADQQEEVGKSWTPLSPAQVSGVSRGVFFGGIAGAIVGCLVGLIWSFLASDSFTPSGRFFIAAIPFLVAGTVAGVVAGGAMRPRKQAAKHPSRTLDAERLPAERDTILAIHVSEEELARRAYRVLAESGAERVDAVDAEGVPLPPQAAHPRPADPDDRWWDADRNGG